MSTFKFSENLFIGKQELDRFLLFMRDQGFVRTLLANSLEFGIVRNESDRSFTNAKVTVGGSAGTVDVNPVLAIDKDGLTVFTSAVVNLSIPDDGNWHWIKISHQFTALEKGTVSIDASGNLTGVNTEFTKVLRGQPNFPSRIRFPDASLNLNEYDVSSVVDDQNAVLKGAFQLESDIKYEVVGTFTPGSFPTEPEKNPFQYDATKFEVIDEPNLPTLTEGKEFYLARCKNNAGTVEIEDKRNSIFRTRADWRLSSVDQANNPLIGVEGIHYGTSFSPLNQNVMMIAWGFRSSNWTIDSTLNTVTINGGNGGKYKNTSDFSNGDFDGWRLYTESGEYVTIKSSTLSGSQINLVVDKMDPSEFSDGSQKIVIVPDADAVQIRMQADGALEVPDRVYEFPVNEVPKKIYVEVFNNPNCKYNVQYRYRTFADYSDWSILPNDPVGYYNEQSYDVNGVLKDPVDRQSVPYTSDPSAGYITFVLNPNNLKSRVDELDTGVIFGVTTFALDNSSPLVTLDPSVDTRYQIISHGAQFTLSVDHFIDLNTVNAIEGSEFLLDINADVLLNGFQLRVVQNYVSTGDIGTALLDIDSFLLDAAKEGRFMARFTFDGVSEWIVQELISMDRNTPEVTVGTTAPTSPTEGDIWVDTN